MKRREEFTIVTVTDIGCEPRIPKGARLFCSGELRPENGDYVLVRRGDAPPLIRGYFLREDGSVLLRSFNRDADSYTATAESLEAAGLLVVVRMECDFPAASRAGELPDAAASAPVEERNPTNSVPADSQELLTFEEAQAMLKVRRTKMYALLRSGELRASKVGKLWRVDRTSIREYLAGRTYRVKSGNGAPA